MNFLDFKILDEETQTLRKKNFIFSIRMVGVVLFIFIIKFIVKYHYEKYSPFFILFYLATMFAFPITKHFTKNIEKAILSFYILTNLSIFSLMFLSGGIKAPGTIWLTLLPLFGSGLLGKKGFHTGILLVSFAFVIFIITNLINIEFYPFSSIESYQFEFRVNLIIYTIVSFYFSNYYVTSEVDYQTKVSKEKEKNENLLRILFHDLSNPMQTIRMLVKKINANRNPDELGKMIQQIDKTSIRIIEVLESVRKIKAIEDKKISFELKNYSIYFLVSKSCELFEEKLKEKNIKINILNNEDDQTLINVDQMYFTNQVLANLISNAIKFSDQNSKIEIDWVRIEHFVRINVKDEGIGIPAEMLINIFNTNKQISRIGTYGEVGTGYGMPLVKTFVEEFKGTIEITSFEKNSHNPSGTNITIILPAF